MKRTPSEKDGFVFFVDDNEMTVNKTDLDYCYFKAKQLNNWRKGKWLIMA